MPPGPMPGVPPAGGKRGRGRPTLLTEDLIARIVKHLDELAFFETACCLEGIPPPTGREWLMRGKRARRDGKSHLKTEAIYASFSAAVDAANGRVQQKLLAGIAVHGKRDWKALAWVAKAKFPQQFGTQGTAVVVDTEERTLEDGTVEQTTTVAMQRPAGGDPELDDEDYAEAAAFLLRRKRLKQAAARGSENA